MAGRHEGTCPCRRGGFTEWRGNPLWLPTAVLPAVGGARGGQARGDLPLPTGRVHGRGQLSILNRSLCLHAFVRSITPNARPFVHGALRARACYALQTWYDFSMTRQPYPSDVSDEERAFVAPSLTFNDRRRPAARPRTAPPCPPCPPCPPAGGQGGDCIVRASAGSAHRTGAPWRMMPNAPPPCTVGRRLSAHPALAEGRGRCDARPRSAHAGA